MKKKSDFITNSSSTSFIIGLLDKDIDSIDVDITIKVDLKQYLESKFSNVDSFIEYWDECLYRERDEEFEICKNIIKKGGLIYVLNCESCSEDPIERLLTSKGLDCIKFPDKIKVIQGSGEY